MRRKEKKMKRNQSDVVESEKVEENGNLGALIY